MPTVVHDSADAAASVHAERFFALSRDLLCVVNACGVPVVVNTAMERALGFDAATLRATPLRSLLHADDRARVMALVADCRQGGDETAFRARFRTATGGYRWIAWHLSPPDADGCLYATGRDATAEQLAEATVTASEARLQLLLETLPMMVYEAHPEPPYPPMYVSASLDTLGYARHEWTARPELWVSSLHPDDRDGVLARSAAAIRASHSMSDEYRMIARDGSVRWVHDHGDLRRDASGTVTAWCGVIIDVTERRQTAERLRISEERFRSLSASSPVGVFETDASGTITYANQRLQAIYGMTGSSATDGTWTMRIHPEDRERVLTALHDPATMATEYEAEYRLQLPDGALRRVKARSAPRYDEFGTFTGSVGTVEDVTAQWIAEEQLRQAQKMEAVGQLAGGIAHDFNNLLTVIRTYTEFMLEQIDVTSPLRTDAEEIWKAAGRAASLTGQLLAFSRKQVLQPSVLDVNDVITGMEPMLRRLIGEDIGVVLQLSPEAGTIRADRGQLEQVVMNLVVNARDAMPQGGTIMISSATEELGEETRSGHGVIPGPYVSLSVQDTGGGMDDATRRRVFEPFFTTKEVGRGTGLGLSMAYGIVKQSNGYIWCDSSAGEGTTFRVLLPALALPATPPHEAPGVVHGRACEVVLLAEDEDAIRALSRRILEREGYTVIEARDGHDAMRVAAAYPSRIDLLVTDMVMPNLGGCELFAHLRATRPALRALFVSGYTADDIARRGLSDEGSAFLQKPFTASALAGAAAAALGA